MKKVSRNVGRGVEECLPCYTSTVESLPPSASIPFIERTSGVRESGSRGVVKGLPHNTSTRKGLPPSAPTTFPSL